MDNERTSIGRPENGGATVVACVVFQTGDPEHFLELLRKALGGVAVCPSEPPATSAAIALRTDTDVWLKHPEAAEYLGIAPSTLYRYACQQRIESRKVCGRLEYRRSALDKFKDLHIRPATRWLSSKRIIPTALGSGK
jgi:hypothetical protein